MGSMATESVAVGDRAADLPGGPPPAVGRYPGAMDVAEALAFVAGNHRSVLVTARADGRPQTSPVLSAVDDVGRVVISTRETAMKTANVRRQPAVSVCVVSDDFFSSWVQIDGTADVVSLPDAMDGLVAYYRQVSGEHPDWAEYRSAMEQQRRVLLRISPERAGPDRSG